MQEGYHGRAWSRITITRGAAGRATIVRGWFVRVGSRCLGVDMGSNGSQSDGTSHAPPRMQACAKGCSPLNRLSFEEGGIREEVRKLRSLSLAADVINPEGLIEHRVLCLAFLAFESLDRRELKWTRACRERPVRTAEQTRE